MKIINTGFDRIKCAQNLAPDVALFNIHVNMNYITVIKESNPYIL